MSIRYKNHPILSSKTRIIIFISVSSLAIQNLTSIVLYKINFPYAVDYADIFVPVYDFLVNGEFTLFLNKNIHIMLFPKLIALPNFYLNSFDVVNISYVIWILISISTFFLYLLLIQTDKKLIWVIIPISAFLYNPLTTHNSYAMAMLSWYIPMFGMTLIVYLLNKKLITFKNFTPAISLAIMSSFSILLGVVTWIVGFFMLLKLFTEKINKPQKWISLWIISTIIIGISYVSLVSSHNVDIQFNDLFSFTTFSFIANFVASSFRLKYQFLLFLAGTISIILAGIFIYYFQTKNYLKNYLPWITFILTTFFAAIITALGRMHMSGHLGNDPFYSTVSQFFQIGLVVLCSKIILDLREKPNNSRRNIIIYLLILLIISQMVLLIPSYYAGWQRADYYFEQRMIDLNCFSPKPDQKCIEISCNNCIIGKDPKYLSSINYMIENNQSIFTETKFEKVNPELLKTFSNYSVSDETSLIGKITHVNQKNISDENLHYNLESEFIQIDGWMKKPIYQNLDKIYLKIDDKLLIEYDDFQILDDDIKNNSSIINWKLFVMSGYIPDNCNLMNIYIIQNQKIIPLDNEISICK